MTGYTEAARRFLGGVSVRTKILGIVLALTTVLGLGVTWQVRSVMSAVLTDELDSRGGSVASDLAGRAVEPILLDNTLGLHDLLANTVANHPDALYAYVLDPAGTVIAHTFEEAGFPTRLLELRLGADGEAVFSTGGDVVHEFAQPILDGELGVIRLGLSETRLRRVIDATTGQMLLTTAAVSALGIAAAVLLTWLLTRPILDLVDVTKRVGAGDLSARASAWAEDEIGTLASAFNTMVSQLEASQQRIKEDEAARTRLLQQLIRAQEDERRRIARELHDGIGQALNSITLGVRNLGKGSPEAASHAAELETLTGETLQIVRQLSRELRPAALDDLGLSAAFENYAAAFQRRYPEIQVDSHIDLPDRLDPAIETALYRMVQEAITNVGRHADARTLSIVIGRHDGKITAIIEDDGRGFDIDAVRRAGKSVGIHGMGERAELVGGSVRFESSRNGTTVFIEVPA